MKKEVIEDLINVCDELRTCIENIRYCDWPTIGLGIDLKPSELDELLSEAARVIRRTRYNLTKDGTS